MTPPTSGCARRSRSSVVGASPAMSSMTGPRASVVTAGSAVCSSCPRPRFRAVLCARARRFAPRAVLVAQADEQRPRDDRVADVQLAHAGERGDGLDVDVVERVAGVEAHARGADGGARGHGLDVDIDARTADIDAHARRDAGAARDTQSLLLPRPAGSLGIAAL